MKGAYSFTICGDPLFFSPELVNHQGYDYSADLWALGILGFEMYEESTPFGTADTDETKIFKAISAYSNQLPFTDKTPKEAQKLILALLNPAPHLRLGYLMDDAVQKHPYFAGTCIASMWSTTSFSMCASKGNDLRDKRNDFWRLLLLCVPVFCSLMSYFLILGIKWASLGDAKTGRYVDVQPSLDLTDTFADEQLEAWDSTTFSQY